MSIKPLPPETVNQIKSSVNITSLNEAIAGLLKNSLDARARRVNISVDYSRGNCSIEDDGEGIPHAEFLSNGGLGRLHHTSRYPPREDTYGSHGDFIASLAALSLLSITSRHHSHASSNTIIIHNSKTLARNTPALPEHRLLTFNRGTRTTVRDLFGNMAVRVKQRPPALEKAVLDREFNRLVQDLAGIMLAWPTDVNLYLQDSDSRNEVRFRPSTAGPNHSEMPSRTSKVLVQSGLADELSYGTWVSVGATAGNLSVRGCISLNAVATRRAQFISMGIHPMVSDKGFGVLYDEANRVFTNSDFSGPENPEPQPKDFFLRQDLKSKRSPERWPMFFLQVEPTTPTGKIRSFDELLDQPQRLSKIIDLVTMICFEFLKKYRFRPRTVSSARNLKRQNSGPESSATASKRTKTTASTKSRSGTTTPVSRPESPFSLWQRVKVGKARQSAPKLSMDMDRLSPFPLSTSVLTPLGEPSSTSKTPLVDKDGRLLRKPFENPGLPPSLFEGNKHVSAPPAASTTSLEAPKDKIGAAASKQVNDAQGAEPRHLPVQAGAVSKLFQESIRLAKAKPQGEPSKWLQGVMGSWENPVFPAVEAAIPRVEEATATTGVEVRCGGHDCKGPSVDISSVKLQGRLSKQALLDAEVISQVDSKFILVKLRQDSEPSLSRGEELENTSLIMIDQHAADERCRLEALMRGYFALHDGVALRAETTSLSVPLTFEFNVRECELIRRHRTHFEHWGIFQKFGAPAQRLQRTQSSTVDVVSLPPTILERCRAEPKLLADLLRNEVWRLEEDGWPMSSQSARSANAGDWVSNFQGCPPGIMEMLNSRSCRSAIMFNDVLSREQCLELVQRLAGCSFPFQCAHGRPSMVPLMDLRSFSSVLRGGLRQRESFGRKLREAGLAI